MAQHDIQNDILRKMSAQQKLEAAAAIYYSAKQLKSAWLRQLHSEWSDQKVEQAVREAFINARS
jgi:hypothetical protein